MSRESSGRFVPCTASRYLVVGAVLMFAVGAAACSKSADDHFKKANDYLAKSQLPEAIVEYRAALQVDGKRGDIRLKLADALLQNHDRDNALHEYVRAADQLPNDVTVQLKAGALLLEAEDWEDAKGRADRAIALEPKNVEAQILRGHALAGLKDINGAIREYVDAIVLDPTQDRAYTSLGTLQFAKGQQAEAEASFKKAMELAPKSLQARLALANLYWATRRPALAEQTLKEGLVLAPTDPLVNRALAVFYLASGRPTEAEPYFKSLAQGSDPSAKVTLADFYIAARRLDEAEKTLRPLVSNKETQVVATTRLAAVMAAKGEWAQGLAIVQELLAKEPKETSARLVHARLLKMSGRPDEALAEATSIINDDPTSPLVAEAYVDIGQIQAKRDRNEDAIKAYEEALRRRPQSLGANLGLASIYMTSGNVKKARTYVEAAVGAQPGDARAHVAMIRLLLAENNVAQAREALLGLQKQFPNSPTVLNLLAAQQRADHQLDAARASYSKVLESTPADVEALTGLIGLDLAANRPQDAVARVEATLKRTPQPSADLYVIAGRTYGAAKDFAKTEEMLKKAIDADPSRLRAYSLLGSLYVSQNRLDDARKQFEQIAAKSPKSTSANTMLGLILHLQNKLPEAEKQYQHVLAEDGNAAVAANNLAWMYVTSNRNLDQALQLAQTSQKQQPDEPHVNDTLGWIYYRKNMPALAVRHLESSVKNDPSDPASHYHLGMAYVQAGAKDKARAELKRALAFNKDFDGIDEARKTLAQIGG